MPKTGPIHEKLQSIATDNVSVLQTTVDNLDAWAGIIAAKLNAFGIKLNADAPK